MTSHASADPGEAGFPGLGGPAVLHLISSSGVYGAEKMAVSLAKAQAELGAIPTLMAFRNSHAPNIEVADYARAHGVPATLLPCGGRVDPRAVRHLRAAVKRLGPGAVVHAHGYKANLYAYLATRRLPVTVVATCHRFDQGPNNKYDARVLPRLDGVLAVSDEARDSVRAVYGVPAERCWTIPNGIQPVPFLDATAMPSPGPAGGPPEGWYDLAGATVGMVARLAPEKAPGDFLEAAAAIVAHHGQTRFIVAGDGPLRIELELQARDLGIADHVWFTGFVDDMPGLYADLQVLVQPSLREGMPMTLLEAMASQVAVVATDVGGASQVITSGTDGIIVEPGHPAEIAAAVGELLADPARRQRIAEAGRERVLAEFTAERMAERYLDAYRILRRG